MRLLLVEDSARLRDLLAERVRGAGWRLDVVGTFAEATEATRSILYDLLLVDLGLPDGDGRSLIKAVRMQGSPVPILVLTARGSIDDRVEALDCGADDYLVKPFNHGELMAHAPASARSATISWPRLKGRPTMPGQRRWMMPPSRLPRLTKRTHPVTLDACS